MKKLLLMRMALVFLIAISLNAQKISFKKESSAPVTSGDPVRIVSTPGGESLIIFSPESAVPYDLKTGTFLTPYAGLKGPMAYIATAASAPFILAATQEGALFLLDTKSGVTTGSKTIQEGMISAAAVSDDGKLAAVATQSGSIYTFNLPSMQETGKIQAHAKVVKGLHFIENGSKIISVSIDKKISVSDVASSRFERSFTDDGMDFITATAVNSTGEFIAIASGSANINIYIFRISESKLVKKVRGPIQPVSRLGFIGESPILYAFSGGEEIELFNSANGNSIGFLKNSGSKIIDFALSDFGTPSYTLSLDRNLSKWNASLPGDFADLAANKISNLKNSRNSKPKKGNKLNNADKSEPLVEITYPGLSRGLEIPTDEKKITVRGVAQDPEGIYEILVNGTEASIADDGSFWAEIKLAPGENNVEVVVTDINDNQSSKKFKINRNAADDSADPDAVKTSGMYYALMIGVNNYADPKINSLLKPVSDAEALKKTLISYYNFDDKNITFLKNPRRGDILASLENLRKKISPEDNLLIFYAGHGYWDEDIKQGYWMPADAEKSNRANWISNGDLRDYLRAIKSQHTLLISDACFSGGIFRTRAIADDAPSSIQELYNLPSRKGLTSGTLTEVSDESVFIKYLIKRLTENKEKYLTAEDLYSAIRSAVINNSKQVPQYGEIQEAGDEGGDFIFIKK